MDQPASFSTAIEHLSLVDHTKKGAKTTRLSFLINNQWKSHTTQNSSLPNNKFEQFKLIEDFAV